MWDWMQANANGLNIIVNAAMLLVWLAYLQLILASFRRANRAVIHISAAVEADDDARCLVTNMGSDAAFLLGIKVDLDCGGEAYSVLVTDRVHDDGPLGGNLRERTNQGPLCGGEVLDIGSFRKICEPATRSMHGAFQPEDCSGVEITVIVAAQQAHRLAGGHKHFDITHEGGKMRFRPDDVLTRQIGSRAERRRLRRELTG